MTDSNQSEKRPLSVLLVEDSAADAELIVRELKRGGFAVFSERVETAEEFNRRITQQSFDVILTDYSLPHWRGLEVVEHVRSHELDIPVILVTGALGDVNAVECIKQGVTDYVLKDKLTRLPVSVKRAIEENRLRRQQKQAEVERQQAAEALSRNLEELARSNRELEQFAYVASHDLQEPLRMVAAYTQLLAERYRGRLDADADKYIGYAVEGAQRMQTLVQDLLNYSRVGRKGEVPAMVDCNAALDSALLNLQAAIHESGAEITHSNLPSLIADRQQLVQLFQNLVGNAIKFRGAEPPRIAVSAEKLEDQWVLAVRDNGIGIAPEHAESIFMIFQRLHTRTEYPGNGIGLAICKKIVEQQGGKIWVESQPGQGSTFKFTLPACAADENSRSGKEVLEHAAASA